MSNAVDWINQKYHKGNLQRDIKAGDTVKVHVRIKEGEKERIQIYEGVVIRIHRQGAGSSFTVRKISYGVGVERVFSFTTPSIERIERVTEGRVRRAKLYYLRQLTGKKARIQARETFGAVITGEDTVSSLSENTQSNVAVSASSAEAK